MKKILIYGLISLFFFTPFLIFAEKTIKTIDGNVVTTITRDNNNVIITKTDDTYTDEGRTTIVSKTTTHYQSDGETVAGTVTNIYNPDGKNPQRKINTYDPTGKIITREVVENYDLITGFTLDQTTITRDAAGKVISTEKYLGDNKKDAVDVTNNVFLIENCGIFNSDASCYEPLAPIQGPDGEEIDGKDFPTYLQAIYRIGIGACFVLGVIMFTWAGIEYIVSESMTGKSEAKGRITAALTGLAIALVSYILLNTINPDLLKLQKLDVTSNADTK